MFKSAAHCHSLSHSPQRINATRVENRFYSVRFVFQRIGFLVSQIRKIREDSTPWKNKNILNTVIVRLLTKNKITCHKKVIQATVLSKLLNVLNPVPANLCVVTLNVG